MCRCKQILCRPVRRRALFDPDSGATVAQDPLLTEQVSSFRGLELESGCLFGQRHTSQRDKEQDPPGTMECKRHDGDRERQCWYQTGREAVRSAAVASCRTPGVAAALLRCGHVSFSTFTATPPSYRVVQLRIGCHRRRRSTRKARTILQAALEAAGRSSTHEVSSLRLAGQSLQHTSPILVLQRTLPAIMPGSVAGLRAASRHATYPLMTHQPTHSKLAVSSGNGRRLPSSQQTQLLRCGPCCGATCSRTMRRRSGRLSGAASSATSCTGTPGVPGVCLCLTPPALPEPGQAKHDEHASHPTCIMCPTNLKRVRKPSCWTSEGIH